MDTDYKSVHMMTLLDDSVFVFGITASQRPRYKLAQFSLTCGAVVFSSWSDFVSLPDGIAVVTLDGNQRLALSHRYAYF